MVKQWLMFQPQLYIYIFDPRPTQAFSCCGPPPRRQGVSWADPVAWRGHAYLQSGLLVIATVVGGRRGCVVVAQPGHQDKVLAVERGHRV